MISFDKNFLWSNHEKLTYQQKKWLIENRVYESCGYFPNIDNPKSFNEKIQWLLLHYDDPTISICVDKYEFKNYIKEKLGDVYTIPLIGLYDDVNDIAFDSLPNKFVIKSTTIGSGQGVEIVKDKSKLDIDAVKYKFNNLLQDWNNLYYYDLSLAYKRVKTRIIIEEYMEQIEGQLYDYKFHCFNGEPKMVLAVHDRTFRGDYNLEFLDMNWNRLNFHRGHKDRLIKAEKPKYFDEMVRISKILAKEFPFVRVDFYEVNDRIYVGELTFAPAGGFGKYEPLEWDYKLGELLDLSKLNKEYLIESN